MIINKKIMHLVSWLILLSILSCGPQRPKPGEQSGPLSITSVFQNANPTRVLSIDGGGVNTLVTLGILNYIVEATGGKEPYELFDVIVGTGSGGLLAAALTTPKENGLPRTTKELLDFFENNAEDLFNPGKSKSGLGLGLGLGLGKPSQDDIRDQAKAKMFKELFGVHFFKDAIKPTVITAINLDDDKPFIFVSSADKYKNLKTSEVLNASFNIDFSKKQDITIKDDMGVKTYRLSSGERLKMNPALLAMQQTIDIVGGIDSGMLLISIGTGDTGQYNNNIQGKNLATAGITGWLGIVNLLIHGSSSEDDTMVPVLLDDYIDSEYIRIQPRIKNEIYSNIADSQNTDSVTIQNLAQLAKDEKKDENFKRAIESLIKPRASNRDRLQKITDDVPSDQITEDSIVILSIDGGGIRGILPASILEHFEEVAGEPASKIFDIIAGTSTGGIIAVGLTMPNEDNSGPVMSAKSLKELYMNKGKTIFTKASFFRTIKEPTYVASGLEGLISDITKNKPFNKALVPTLITAFDLDKLKGYLLKSDDPVVGHIPVVGIARATSAAPIFFPAKVLPFEDKTSQVKEHYMSDGGLWKNNPALLALVEAKKKFGWQEIKKRGVILVSIGTGNFLFPLKSDPLGIQASVNTTIEISSHEDNQMLEYLMKDMPHSRFFRIQPDLDNKKNPGLEDMDNIKEENINNLLNAAQEAKNTPVYKKVIEFFKARSYR